MSFTPINLAALPDPQVVEQIDYERLLLQRKAYALSLWPAEQQGEIAERLALDSDPISKLLQENAYRELLLRQRVNEAALATLLAKAGGTDLDQLAANYNVQRLLISAAATNQPAQWESDEALRERSQMAFEGLATAGPRNSYIFHARSASALVADATAESPSPAVVLVTVQSLQGDGTASPALLESVRQYLSDDDRRPVADRLNVQGAEVLPYVVNAVLHLSTNGPEVEPIRQAAYNALQERVNQRRRLGIEVPASAIYAALHVEGVSRVELQNWHDLLPTPSQASYCTAINLSVAQPT